MQGGTQESLAAAGSGQNFAKHKATHNGSAMLNPPQLGAYLPNVMAPTHVKRLVAVIKQTSPVFESWSTTAVNGGKA